MNDLQRLQFDRDAKKALLDVELKKFAAMNHQCIETGIRPENWEAQTEALRVAQVAFDEANDAYVNACSDSA